MRVQSCDSSRVNPQLIARYSFTPRIGRRIDDRSLLNATGTALVIAMDSENTGATAEQRDAERRSLMEAIGRDVLNQGADIHDDYLNLLDLPTSSGQPCSPNYKPSSQPTAHRPLPSSASSTT